MYYKNEPKIKNRTYYFFNDITDIKHFDLDKIRIDDKPYKNILDCMLLSCHVRVSE